MFKTLMHYVEYKTVFTIDIAFSEELLQ